MGKREPAVHRIPECRPVLRRAMRRSSEGRSSFGVPEADVGAQTPSLTRAGVHRAALTSYGQRSRRHVPTARQERRACSCAGQRIRSP